MVELEHIKKNIISLGEDHLISQETLNIPVGVEGVSPSVYTIDNFISSDDCEHFINISRDKIKQALVSGSKEGFVSQGRSGSNCWIKHDYDAITKRVADKISDLVGFPLENAEAFQVIHYGIEQEYRQHYDGWLFDGSEKSRRNMRLGGQRMITALAYLNTVPSGGGTKFTKLETVVKSEKGKLLVFSNVYEGSNKRHELSEHAGMPVLEGEKWAFNLWFREKSRKVMYDYIGGDPQTPLATLNEENKKEKEKVECTIDVLKDSNVKFEINYKKEDIKEDIKEDTIKESFNPEVGVITTMDTWVSPFSIKIVHNFLNDDQYSFLQNIIKNKDFIPACQGVGNKQVVQEEHKIRFDYTLNTQECEFLDKPLIYKADCNCNLRERWRLLYYDGNSDKKSFRGPHTDWTTHCCHRRMSIIIGLSNPDEYDGGELVFKNNNLKYKIERGAAVIFDGKLLHEVLPVTKGKRYVIQSFMFNDNGYDLKKTKNGKQNFALLGPEPNNMVVPIKKENTISNLTIEPFKNTISQINENNEWTFIENQNAVHSRIASVDDCYIGTFQYIQDLLDILEKNKDIMYFTWHKPNHHNPKWRGRAYGWTYSQCEQKRRTDTNTWPSENNMLSGYKKYKKKEQIKLEVSEKSEKQLENFANNLTEEERNNKYLTNINTDGGPGNQIVGIKEAMIMAKILDRKLLVPPILQHYVLNRIHRGGGKNNEKYWKFSEIFNYKHIDENNSIGLLELVDNKHILENSKSQYYIRRQDIDTKLKMDSLLDLKAENKVCLNNRSFRNINDYNELKAMSNEHLLTVTHLYNCTAISQCCWNGCDTCEMNPEFFKIYREICNKFDYSEKIKAFGDEYVNAIFDNAEFLCLHLRYSDYGDDRDLKDVTKLYNESDINNLIIKLCEKEGISPNNVFVATSNQKRLLNSDLKVYKLLDKKVEYNEFESFIEQYICSRSKIFIYSGGLTDRDKGKHQHLRSTWASFVVDYRSYLLNKDTTSNIYLTNQFK